MSVCTRLESRLGEGGSDDRRGGDALIAALKVKSAHPEAAITYVRKQNARGDRRHPHVSRNKETPAEPSA